MVFAPVCFNSRDDKALAFLVHKLLEISAGKKILFLLWLFLERVLHWPETAIELRLTDCLEANIGSKVGGIPVDLLDQFIGLLLCAVDVLTHTDNT